MIRNSCFFHQMMTRRRRLSSHRTSLDSSEITWTSHVAECCGTTVLSLSLQDPFHWIFLHSWLQGIASGSTNQVRNQKCKGVEEVSRSKYAQVHCRSPGAKVGRITKGIPVPRTTKGVLVLSKGAQVMVPKTGLCLQIEGPYSSYWALVWQTW